ncbi:MAG: 4-hydroxy-tetrahydrodipicolinate synthase [Marinilabiliales bacterium]|nr:MAG: 4-hydroxy-tetrahydrodipicolinate synthase [Marinilabiliales bacterium]
MNMVFKGTGVAIVTPFDKHKQVDYPAIERLLNHIIKGGVEFVVAMGTTSEAVTLDESEKMEVLLHIIQVVNGQLPIVLGIGGNNTKHVIDSIQSIDLNQISGILSVAPYYNKPNQLGLYEHFSAIAKSCPRPIILYNVPGRTSSNMSAQTTLKLANEFENIVAVKEASGDFNQIMKIIQNRPAHFNVLSGDDALTLPMISVGAEGVISVVANAFPKEFSDMVRLALKGNFIDAGKLHYALLDIIEQLFADGNPAGIKKALSVLNILDENLRLPLVNVNEEVSEKLNTFIHQFID